jgi:hypothetical protein
MPKEFILVAVSPGVEVIESFIDDVPLAKRSEQAIELERQRPIRGAGERPSLPTNDDSKLSPGDNEAAWAVPGSADALSHGAEIVAAFDRALSEGDHPQLMRLCQVFNDVAGHLPRMHAHWDGLWPERPAAVHRMLGLTARGAPPKTLENLRLVGTLRKLQAEHFEASGERLSVSKAAGLLEDRYRRGLSTVERIERISSDNREVFDLLSLPYEIPEVELTSHRWCPPGEIPNKSTVYLFETNESKD